MAEGPDYLGLRFSSESFLTKVSSWLRCKTASQTLASVVMQEGGGECEIAFAGKPCSYSLVPFTDFIYDTRL